MTPGRRPSRSNPRRRTVAVDPSWRGGRSARAPLLIVHGSANPFMPVDEAHRLYVRTGESKELLIIPGPSIGNGLTRPASSLALESQRRRPDTVGTPGVLATPAGRL